MGTTIRDVAKLAGVSASTVSRVLNHKSVISPETSEKIRKAMRDLNYVPNDLARGLAKATSHVIGLAVDTRKIMQLAFSIEQSLRWRRSHRRKDIT